MARMTPEQYGKLCRLFDQAQQIRPGKARIAFLDRVCAGDPALRAELEQLLAHDDKARSEGFLLPPALPVAPPPEAAKELLPTASFHAAEAHPGEAPIVLMEGYVAERKLGEGGMGEVLLVRHRDDNRLYAVKRAKLQEAEGRRRFLAELQTWIALPEHPHLAPCRFFRSVGQDIVIFADFVDGGSLADWIKDRRLYRGDPHETVRRVLDIAIQAAWGLHALHSLGLVHQDVKPGNILMARDGVARISDFGLARAMKAADCPSPSDSSHRTLLASWGGMTRAYCSPEQAFGRPLSRKTDIWSWGVSLLHMFKRKIDWRSGTDAPRILVDLTDSKATDLHLAVMPIKVAEILARCFQTDPAERWPTLATAAQALVDAYNDIGGHVYPRIMPPEPEPTRMSPHERDTAGGIRWEDPYEWLRKALTADGRSLDEVKALILPREGSREAQAIADLAAYNEALEIYDRLVANGRSDLRHELANLCSDKAIVHDHLEDRPHAIELFDRAIRIYRRLVPEGGAQILADLACAYLNKAATMAELGDLPGAMQVEDRAITLHERLIADGLNQLSNSLAKCYMNKACWLRQIGETERADELFAQAIEIRSRLLRDGQDDLAFDLALALGNEATNLHASGRFREAGQAFDRAIDCFQRLAAQGQVDAKFSLALSCMNKGNLLQDMDEAAAACPLYDQAIRLHEELISVGRCEREEELARSWMNKGNALKKLGRPQEATGLYERSKQICERLIRAGRDEIRTDLASTFVNHGNALRQLEDRQRAAHAFERAVVLYRQLVAEGRSELEGRLAMAIMDHGVAILELGNAGEGEAILDQSLSLYERLVGEGRRELRQALAGAYMNRAVALMQRQQFAQMVRVYDRAIALYESLLADGHDVNAELATARNDRKAASERVPPPFIR